MKKEAAILLLSEGISVEEIPTLINLSELLDLVKKGDFDSATRKKLNKGLKRLNKDSIRHAESFNNMLKFVAKSKKNEY